MTRVQIPVFGVLLLFVLSACAVDFEPEPADENTESVLETSLEVLAQAGPVIRSFVANGSGCRNVEDPIVDGNSVTLVLADYVAAKNGPGIDRATCDVAVEVDLPAGVTVSLNDVTYKGFSRGVNARSSFFREYFFAGDFAGDRRFTVIDYDGAGRADFVQNDSDAYSTRGGEFTARDRVLSVRESCGGDVVWRVNTALTVRNDENSSSSLASIDTVTATNRFHVTFQFGPYESCN